MLILRNNNLGQLTALLFTNYTFSIFYEAQKNKIFIHNTL